MAARKPKIEYHWTWRMLRGPKGGQTKRIDPDSYRVNWRLIGANGEVMCGSNRGFRDKTDAQRAVDAVASTLFGRASPNGLLLPRHVGPGKKPVPTTGEVATS